MNGNGRTVHLCLYDANQEPETHDNDRAPAGNSFINRQHPVLSGRANFAGRMGCARFGLGALGLGFAERRTVPGKMAVALLALFPGMALIGWLRWTVTG
ncbi:hypothetical protein [Neorhizobium sp. DT-125]|uniref:hypothetical protein n=1 Tax=Neorhizobium sp. DT-125 TaxID=3396163 RepID=UPI003F1BFA6D